MPERHNLLELCGIGSVKRSEFGSGLDCFYRVLGAGNGLVWLYYREGEGERIEVRSARDVGGCRFAIGAGTQLGRAPKRRPYKSPAVGSKMSIGRPDIEITIPDSCQLESRGRPAREFVPHENLGRSQTQIED